MRQRPRPWPQPQLQLEKRRYVAAQADRGVREEKQAQENLGFGTRHCQYRAFLLKSLGNGVYDHGLEGDDDYFKTDSAARAYRDLAAQLGQPVALFAAGVRFRVSRWLVYAIANAQFGSAPKGLSFGDMEPWTHADVLAGCRNVDFTGKKLEDKVDPSTVPFH